MQETDPLGSMIHVEFKTRCLPITILGILNFLRFFDDHHTVVECTVEQRREG